MYGNFRPGFTFKENYLKHLFILILIQDNLSTLRLFPMGSLEALGHNEDYKQEKIAASLPPSPTVHD